MSDLLGLFGPTFASDLRLFSASVFPGLPYREEGQNSSSPANNPAKEVVGEVTMLHSQRRRSSILINLISHRKKPNWDIVRNFRGPCSMGLCQFDWCWGIIALYVFGVGSA
jgi:hypothetical protein